MISVHKNGGYGKLFLSVITTNTEFYVELEKFIEKWEAKLKEGGTDG